MSNVHLRGLGAILALWAGVARAHHSFAMFDETRVERISGTIVKVGWVNPHVEFWVAVPDKDGNAEIWTIESPQSPANLRRFDWSRDTLKVGDKVQVSLSPLRDGRTGGSLQKLSTPDGKNYYDGSRGPDGGPLGPDGKPRALPQSHNPQ